MSTNENQKILAVIKIVDFPSRNEVIDYFKSFMKQATVENDYSIKNKANEIFLMISNHELALKFLETFNNEISNNLLYSNCECSLSFKAFPSSVSLPKIKNTYKIVFYKNTNNPHSLKKLHIVKKINNA